MCIRDRWRRSRRCHRSGGAAYRLGLGLARRLRKPPGTLGERGRRGDELTLERFDDGTQLRDRLLRRREPGLLRSEPLFPASPALRGVVELLRGQASRRLGALLLELDPRDACRVLLASPRLLRERGVRPGEHVVEPLLLLAQVFDPPVLGPI